MSGVVVFARLLSRICSVANSPPQTLHRQPGDTTCAITCIDGGYERLAFTSSLLQLRHCR